MELTFVDPRALKENPDKARRSKSNPQADALLLATIRAVGIVQPPVVAPEVDGGNGYVIDAGHRRVKQAIAAGLEEIAILVIERAEDGGAMRSLAETLGARAAQSRRSVAGDRSPGRTRLDRGGKRCRASATRSPDPQAAAVGQCPAGHA